MAVYVHVSGLCVCAVGFIQSASIIQLLDEIFQLKPTWALLAWFLGVA